MNEEQLQALSELNGLIETNPEYFSSTQIDTIKELSSLSESEEPQFKPYSPTISPEAIQPIDVRPESTDVEKLLKSENTDEPWNKPTYRETEIRSNPKELGFWNELGRAGTKSSIELGTSSVASILNMLGTEEDRVTSTEWYPGITELEAQKQGLQSKENFSTENALYQVGEDIRAWSDNYLEENPWLREQENQLELGFGTFYKPQVLGRVIGQGLPSLLVGVGSTVGATALTGNPIVGMATGMSVTGILEAGGAYTTAKEYGSLSPEEQRKVALLVGGFSTLVSALPLGRLAKKMGVEQQLKKEFTSKIIKKNLYGKISAEGLKQGLAEATEEVAQELINIKAEIDYMDEADAPTKEEILKRIGESGYGGFILGTGTGVVTEGPSIKRQLDTEKFNKSKIGKEILKARESGEFKKFVVNGKENGEAGQWSFDTKEEAEKFIAESRFASLRGDETGISITEDIVEESDAVLDMAERLAKQNPDAFEKKSILNFVEETRTITREQLKTQINKKTGELYTEEEIDQFFTGEGLGAKTEGASVLGSTLEENGKVLINLYKGARPDTVIEEFYGNAFRNLSAEEKSVFSQFYEESGSVLTEQEFFEKEGVKHYINEKLYENTTVQKVYRKLKQFFNEKILGNTTLDPKIRKMWEDAGYAKVGEGVTSRDESFQLKPTKQKKLYHVTPTKNVSNILEKGLSPFQTTLWEKPDGTRQGEGEIFVFENLEDAKRWKEKILYDIGEKASILEIDNKDDRWAEDGIEYEGKFIPANIMGPDSGRWFKRHDSIASENIKELTIKDDPKRVEFLESGKRILDKLEARDKKPKGKDESFQLSNQKVAKLNKTLMELTKEGASARFWYERSGKALLDVVDGDYDKARKLLSIIAITSPQMDVKSNFGQMIKANYKYVQGMEPEAGRFPKAMAKRIKDVMEGKDFGGIKTNSFLDNLLAQLEEVERAPEDRPVTIDLWMMRALGFDKDVPTTLEYKKARKVVQDIADKIGWEPHQVQASIWTSTQARWNQIYKQEIAKSISAGTLKKVGKSYKWRSKKSESNFRKRIFKRLKTEQVSQQAIADANFDYVNAIDTYKGIVSTETFPHPTTEVFKDVDFSKLKYEDLLEYDQEVRQLVVNENGKDKIAELVGLLQVGKFNAPGFYEKESVPSEHLEVLMSTTDVSINPETKTLLELYSSIYGIVFKQQAVGVTKVFPSSSKLKANVITVETKANLDYKEIYNQLYELGYDTGPTPFDGGFQIVRYGSLEGDISFVKTEIKKNKNNPEKLNELNSRLSELQKEQDKFLYERDSAGKVVKKKNIEFQNAVEKVLNNLLVNSTEGANIDIWQSDGLLVENDWSINKNGESYKQRIGQSEQSNIIESFIDRTSDEISKINDRFRTKWKGSQESFQITAFHGSPYKFDQFDSSQIGSGEGAQAFGHGLYFSSKEDVAKWYIPHIPPTDSRWEATPRSGSLYNVTLHKGKDPSEYDYISWVDKVPVRYLGKLQKEYEDLMEANTDLLKSGSGTRVNPNFFKSLQIARFSGNDLYRAIQGNLELLGYGQHAPKATSDLFLDAGIDGIRFPAQGGTGGRFGDTENFVVFDDSAVTIDKQESFQLAPKVMPSDTRMEALKRNVQDKLQRLEKAQKIINVKDEEMDAYLESELYLSRVRARLDDMDKDINNFLGDLSKTDITLDDLGMYLYAQHAGERDAEIKKRKPDLKFDASGWNAEKLGNPKSYMVGGKNYKKGSKALAIRFRNEIVEKRLDVLLSGGLITQKTYDLFKSGKVYKNYVPLKGIANGEVFSGAGKGFQLTGKDIIGAGGRQSFADNPAMQSINDLDNSIIRSEKNIVNQALYRLIEANPLNNPDGTKYWEVKSIPQIPRFDENGDINYFEPKSIDQSKEMIVFFDGKAKKIVINDPLLYDNLNNIGAGKGIKFLSTMNNLMRNAYTTYSPTFWATNFQRDAGMNFLINVMEDRPDIAVKTVKNIGPAKVGIAKALAGGKGKWVDIYNDFVEQGGKMGWIESQTLEERKANLENRIKGMQKRSQLKDGFKLIASAIEGVNTVFESSTRLATYKALLDSGYSKKRASQIAKNITVNFNKKGAKGGFFNAGWLFWNAGVQGNFNSAKNSVPVKGDSSKRVLKKLAFVSTLMGTGYMVAKMLRGDDEDQYDRMSDYQRFTKLMIPYGDGQYFPIQLPYGFNFYYALGVLMEEMENGDLKPSEGAIKALHAFTTTFNPFQGADLIDAMTPTLAKPTEQILRNIKYTGGYIRPDDKYNPVPPSENYYDSANPFNIKWTEKLNELTGGTPLRSGAVSVNPENVDHIIDFLGPLVNTGFDAITGQELNSARISKLWKVSTENKYKAKKEVNTLLRKSKTRRLTLTEYNRFERYLDLAIKDGTIYEDEREGLELELDKHQEKVLMPLDKANLYKEVERGIRHFTQEGYTIEEIDDFYNLVDKAYDEEVITKRKYKILTNKLEKAEERLEGND